jgi:hypothetical protein
VSCEHDPTRLWLYAGAALEPAEARQLEAHLSAGCAACEAELARAEQAMAGLLVSVEPVPPPASVKQRVLRAGHAGTEVEPAAVGAGTTASTLRRLGSRPTAWVSGFRRRRVAWAGGAFGAAALLALALLVGLDGEAEPGASSRGEEQGTAASRVETLERRLNRSRQKLASARQKLAALDQPPPDNAVLEMLDSKAAQVVPLTAARPGTWGRLLWDPKQNRGFLFVAGLKPAGEGRSYTLWVTTRSGRAAAVRSFEPSGAGPVVFELPAGLATRGPIRKASISIDPADGANEPQSPMLTGHFPATPDRP